MRDRDDTTGPLRPLELATAAVLGGVSVILIMVGWWVPHASAVGAAGAIPFGVVAHRHRPRAVVAATVGASAVGFLMAGTGPVSSVATCALIGGLVGDGKRRGWGLAPVLAVAGVIGPVLAAAADGLLALFAPLRTLTLAQIHNSVHGLAVLAAQVPGVGPSARAVDDFVQRALLDWPVTVAVVIIAGVLLASVAAWVVLGQVLDRLAWLQSADRLDLPTLSEPGPPGPLPVSFLDVTYRYPGSSADAVAGVSLAIGAGEVVAVTGDNGSGKSTLTRLLAGRPPTSGRVERLGSPGLGRPDGTAMIFQRPESQVLGVRVIDDVVWGLPPGHSVDVAALLRAVGLSGMEARDASSLSGGELQRLAVAAALARRPRLLISDESTAMVDAAGRASLIGLFGRLPVERGMTVVHVTHREEEALAADRVVHFSEGRLSASAARPGDPAVTDPAEMQSRAIDQAAITDTGAGRLQLREVDHTWAEGTPWATPALSDIDLEIPAGAGLLVVGGNGSGKSTLAWIMAGLLRPSVGECLFAGQPVSSQIGVVGLAFQHARLQVQRPTVRSDVCAAGGVGTADAYASLLSVGLHPEEMGDRHTDELSGGQLRRVALAGLLARRSRVLVLDEPLAGLDRPSGAGLLSLLGDLRRHSGLTLVVISHDLEGMGSVCDRLVRLDQGRLVSDEPLVAVP